MDTSSLDPRAKAALEETLAYIDQNRDEFPEWADGADLGRLSVQAHQRQLAGGFELAQPRGYLRFSGEAVHGHKISLSNAGLLMQNWQALVTSVGAAGEGHKLLKGRVPDEINRRTELELSASPSAGSVVLEFEPVARGSDERYPEGQTEISGPAVPLAEQAVDKALEVLDLATGDGDIVGDAVEELLTDLGPRVATAARNLAVNSSKNLLDISFGWEVPGRSRRRVLLTSKQAATFAAVLMGHHLDIEIDEIEGVLRTVSDRRNIDIEIADPDKEEESVLISVDRGEVDFRGYTIGDTVKLQVETSIRPRPGSGDERKYTAIWVERVQAETD